MNLVFYDTKIGRIGIGEDDGAITHVYFSEDGIPSTYEEVETEIIIEAIKQLRMYLDGELKEFSLPLNPSGTDFMKSVWKSLCEIPYGRTKSYKEIASDVGNSKACRAVGMANNKNPIPIFIPCHRVIGSNGKLVGYRGGLEVKKILLQIEKID